LSRQIDLHTHISDIVGLLHYRDLNGVTLVGHSYGGTVITAVAELVPDRIRRLVYLDASVPRDGESNNDVIGPEMAARLRSAATTEGEGWRVPPAPYVAERLPEVLRPWVEARLAPHPWRPFEEPVHLRSKEAAALPRAFIRTSPQSDLYARLLDRARGAGWDCRDLTGGHYAMLTEPQAVAAALAGLAA
jgi:pimeloyl-ACP methyl ester carboxylesterase